MPTDKACAVCGQGFRFDRELSEAELVLVEIQHVSGEAHGTVWRGDGELRPPVLLKRAPPAGVA